MKHIVLFDEYDEIDLKPPELVQQYLVRVKKDVASFLTEPGGLTKCPCPGCGIANISSHFVKYDLQYVECANCHTLYVSPRPQDRALREYYRESSAGSFFRNELSRRTSKHRTAKIIKPRFRWMADSVAEYLPDTGHFVDVNTNQPGYLTEILKTPSFRRKTLVDPLLEELDLSRAEVSVIDLPIQEAPLEQDVDVLSIFEVADRTSDVERLFKKIHGMLKSGGLCFMTTILITGFDLQILWDRAPNLHPPDRLNVFSVEGLNAIFDRCRFECLEFSTPGILDTANVLAAIQRDATLQAPRFIK